MSRFDMSAPERSALMAWRRGEASYDDLFEMRARALRRAVEAVARPGEPLPARRKACMCAWLLSRMPERPRPPARVRLDPPPRGAVETFMRSREVAEHGWGCR